MGKSNSILIRRTKMPKTAPNTQLKAKRAYYPADDEVKNFVRKCKAPAASKGRKCIVQGSVVILLSGRFRGRRVVVLKRMDSGLLLVTGPYKLNGVPLKRVNAAFVIPTSTKLNVSGADVKSVDDAYFAKSVTKSKKNDEEAFFGNNAEMSAEEKAKFDKKKAMQKTVDDKIMGEVKKVEHLAGYLRTRFSLRNNMRFHEMSF